MTSYKCSSNKLCDTQIILQGKNRRVAHLNRTSIIPLAFKYDQNDNKSIFLSLNSKNFKFIWVTCTHLAFPVTYRQLEMGIIKSFILGKLTQ